MKNEKITKPLCILLYRLVAILFIILIYTSTVSAQYTVTIKLQAVPYSHNRETVYAAGSFNGWNPADDNYKLSAANSLSKILNAGKYEFKFTRGAWDRVECNNLGADIANHTIEIKRDTTLTFSVEAWKDDFVAPKKHTASSNVQLLSENFDMPLLHKQRHIWVYLPPGYEKNKKHYPVMYMQDGQNIFDEYFAPFGEWGMDECLDSLIEKGTPGCIVVAIENGSMDRMSEYNPYEFTWKKDSSLTTFPPRAHEYIGDIIHTLKPYIDKQYRTLASKENTIIAGSSMGGLISYYAAIKYPDVFGKAGIFSPAFWTASGIDSLTDSIGNSMKGKYFFYMGGQEGGSYVEDMKRIRDKVGKNSAAFIYSVIDPEAKHNEAAWRKWFAEFYKWMMADGYNVNTGEGN